MKRLLTLFTGVMLVTTCSFAQCFWQEDFADGLPADWENTDLSGQDVLWEYCENDEACSINDINSKFSAFYAATADNGFAMLNSDAYPNLATNHISRLTTHSINCVAEESVFLQFQTAISTYIFNPPAERAKIIISKGEGTDLELFPFEMLNISGNEQWAPVEDIAPEAPFWVTYDISEFAAGANVTISWQWEGNYEYFWVIDDVRLCRTNPAIPENALWYESFAYGMGQWESNLLEATEDHWVWEASGDVTKAFTIPFGVPGFIHSPTTVDGAAVYNADFYYTMGVEPPPPQIPPPFTCELISPLIDLSDVFTPFALQFTQLLSLANISPFAPQTENGAKFITSFAYSTDGGDSWSDPIDTAPFVSPATSLVLMPPTNNQFYFPIPIQALGSSEFRIKFTWAGDSYFWAIDDVAIVERPDWDMRVNRNFYAISPNFSTPACQFTDVPLLADIQNIGSLDAEDVVLKAIVRKDEDNSIIYQDSLEFSTVPVDLLIENQLFNTPLSAESLYEKGSYTGYYIISHDMPDSRPSNDTIRWAFEVTENRYAKENGFTRDISPSNDIGYSLGNIFYIREGEGWFAHEVSFGVNLLSSLAGREIEVILYQWDGDLNNDDVANEEELTILTFTTYQINQDSPDEASLITVSINDYPLEDDTYYLVTVKYPYVNGPEFKMLVDDSRDYQAMNYASAEVGLPQYAGALDAGNDGDFSTIGFGFNIVPMVRLHVTTENDCIDVATQEPAWSSVNMYPNPAKPNAIIQIEVPEGFTNGTLSVHDMSGRSVFIKKLDNILEKHVTFDVRKFQTGTYTVELSNRNFKASAQLVIQQ
jgi:hypothetical protein